MRTCIENNLSAEFIVKLIATPTLWLLLFPLLLLCCGFSFFFSPRLAEEECNSFTLLFFFLCVYAIFVVVLESDLIHFFIIISFFFFSSFIPVCLVYFLAEALTEGCVYLVLAINVIAKAFVASQFRSSGTFWSDFSWSSCHFLSSGIASWKTNRTFFS